MRYLIFLISLAGFIISYKKFKTWHNPYTVFDILWICVGMLLIVGNKYIYAPTVDALSCVVVGISAYNLSMFSPKLKIGGNRKKICLFTEKKFVMDTKRAYVISVIVLVFSVILAISAIVSFISGGSFSDIRTDYYSVSNTDSAFVYYAKEYILSPLRYVIIISSIIALFKGEKKKYLLLLNCLIIVILQAITSGGRYILINSIFMFICGYCLFANKDRIQIKQKIILGCFLLIFMYSIIFITNNRSSFLTQDMSTIQRLYTTIYEYFAGSVTYLGEIINKTPDIAGMTKGVNFVAGWLSPIFAIFTFLGLFSYPKIFNVIGIYACEVLKIGPSTYYNAMPTIFGYFYIDGGMILTFLEAWIFGYICKRIYLHAEKKNLLFNAFYILIFVQICNSSTRWFFFVSDYCLAFLYLLLVIKVGGVLLKRVIKIVNELIEIIVSNKKEIYCSDIILLNKEVLLW